MLKASDIKLGNKLVQKIVFNEEMTYLGTIVGINYFGTTLESWDMDITVTCASKPAQTMRNKGYSREDFSSWEVYEYPLTVDHKKVQEKPCQVCSRPNDVGVNFCWSCGNKP